MRRVKTLNAFDNDNDIEITIAIDSDRLLRHEAELQIDDLTDKIMNCLQGTRFADIKLCRIKVK